MKFRALSQFSLLLTLASVACSSESDDTNQHVSAGGDSNKHDSDEKRDEYASGGADSAGGTGNASATGGNSNSSGGNNDGSGGDDQGSGGTAAAVTTWGGLVVNSGQTVTLQLGGDPELKCDFSDDGLILHLEGASDIVGCNSNNSLRLQLAGVFADTSADIYYQGSEIKLVQAVHQTYPKTGSGCWPFVGQDYNSCSFEVYPSASNAALLTIDGSCEAGQQRWEGAVTFDPTLCTDSLDVGFSSCGGNSSSCGELDLDICEAFTGCTQAQACRGYSWEECSGSSQAECNSKTGCAWSGDYCQGGVEHTCISQPVANCESQGCQLIDVCEGNATCSNASGLQCLALASCTANYPL